MHQKSLIIMESCLKQIERRGIERLRKGRGIGAHIGNRTVKPADRHGKNMKH